MEAQRSARKVLVLADDLTGALESGVLLEGAAAGVERAPEGAAAVIDTETRHLGADEARRRVSEWIEQIRADLIYKKTDSTLRGNIGAELAALPEVTIHYAPAYPRLGRTVRGGRLFVDGEPVERTAFARDPLAPVTDGDIRRVLARQGAPLERIRIHEGERDEDLESAAEAVLREPAPRVAAGPAGLLGVLARRLGLERQCAPLPRAERCLVINGSAHPASRAQMEAAEKAGVFGRGWRTGRVEEAGEWGGALIVFGGETARAVVRIFGDPLLFPFAEPVPGVVASWMGAGQRRLLVTKAGGFGEADLLVRLARLMGRG
ncbi:MAG: four-carbon acid sugar kinase family protein [Bryobacteraceae bacterium]